MGTCIICGTPADGRICSSHEEDVAFEFRGDDANELTTGRYYRGTVDGFADFGVFVDIGDSVTGLLHKSELDQRLESLDWDSGDTVYVQVTDVRDNGNVDLGWSIRQSEDEFRGSLVDDPNGDAPEASAAGNEDAAAEPSGGGAAAASASAVTAETVDDPEAVEEEPEPVDEPETEEETEEALEEADPSRVAIGSLSDRVGDVVRIEGEVTGVRQTSGPTVFELRDETSTIECAAFEEAGVRAYPEVDVDDYVRLEGEVELRRDDLQVETETLVVLEGEDAAAVEGRLTAAMTDKARPDEVAPLADDDPVAVIESEVRDAAEAIRRAVFEARPVVIRHSATADGYAAGAAIEHAVLPLVREEHVQADAEYHYVERRPLDGEVYDMDAATNDVTQMLEARERHGEQLPLVVLVDAGSTLESRDGYRLLDIYGAGRVAIDASHPDEEIVDEVDSIVNPALAGDGEGDGITTTALAANVAANVYGDVRDDLRHLPAVSYWADAPGQYVDLAEAAGYDETAVRERREAIALEAYYQSYDDKRELVADLLFGDGADAPGDAESLAAHVSEQFREKLDTEVETADRNLSLRGENGVTFAVLDTDSFTHRFDFPPTTLLLDELHRRRREDADEPFVTLGIGDDELHVRSTAPVDVRAVGETAREHADEAGITVVGGRDGHLEFLTGERDAVVDGVVAAVAEELGE
ncbi:S1 RNA-binding domain-containing protein [Halostella sp. JP-L12]|uniref:DHH family phosphoesterase n=1 Tax=Halostella TaxID=1843185 RepID=UPI000EF80F85|nr:MULTISPECIES: OB-fold nucleic acid binding domain-containing protein [Halostella]NHN48676.1 S1 RNA-binding domain-containing protein [Halostella sp. JP-L12]